MMRSGRPADPWRDVRRRGAALAATLLLVAGVLLAGCGSGKKESKPAPTPPPAPTAAPVVKTQTRIAHVAGKLPPASRTRVARNVGAAVDAWFEAAYLGGSYPRGAATFKSAFPGFIPGALATARKRLGIMTNAGIATRIDRVVPVTRLVALDLVAAKGRVVGATARVKLVFRTTGKLTAREIVRGQLDLTPASGKWRVFAFDVTKDQTTQKPAQQPSQQPSQQAGGKG